MVSTLLLYFTELWNSSETTLLQLHSEQEDCYYTTMRRLQHVFTKWNNNKKK